MATKKKSKKAKTRGHSKAKGKTRKAAKPTNGTTGADTLDLAGPKPAPKTGPGLNLRARSEAQIDKIKAAAKKAGMSMNTWVVEVLDRAAEAQ